MILPIYRNDVVIDEKARDGTWCTLPYPNHKKGCPNYGKKDCCPPLAPKFEDIAIEPYYLIIEKFNLKAHANKMRKKHPKWTDRQCRNLLYWQGGVRKRLKERAYAFRIMAEEMHGTNFIVLEIPEANGVNLFATMARYGYTLQRDNPQIIKKIMMVVADRSCFSFEH